MAESEQIQFIDLNDKMAGAMEDLGEEKVTGTYFFKSDHTHCSAKGALLAASLVIEGIQESRQIDLEKYLLADGNVADKPLFRDQEVHINLSH